MTDQNYHNPLTDSSYADAKSVSDISDFKSGFYRLLFGEKSEQIRDEVILSECRIRWDSVAGNLKGHSLPVKFNDGVLRVRVVSGVYSQELLLRSSLIINALAVFGVSVKKIIPVKK